MLITWRIHTISHPFRTLCRSRRSLYSSYQASLVKCYPFLLPRHPLLPTQTSPSLSPSVPHPTHRRSACHSSPPPSAMQSQRAPLEMQTGCTAFSARFSMALSRSKSGGNAWLRALPVRTLPLLLPTRNAHLLLAEASTANDPSRYLITLEQMIENDYPIPSYMADVFEKPEGWIETPQPSAPPPGQEGKWKQKVYAIDCEMVSRRTLLFYCKYSGSAYIDELSYY